MDKESNDNAMVAMNVKVPRRMKIAVEALADEHDLDNSKFVRQAVREKLARLGVKLTVTRN